MAKTRINSRALVDAIDSVRINAGVSWRQLSREIGVSPSLLSRLRNGYNPDAEGFMTLTKWLNMPAEQFLHDGDLPGGEQPELLAELAPLLRARKDLDEDDIESLNDVIRATLRQAAAKRGARG